MEVWTEKYRPRSSKELEGNGELVRVLQKFIHGAFIEIERIKKENKEIRAYNRTVPKSKRKKEKTPDTKKVAIVLRGSHGIGKTTTVGAIAKDMNIPLSESNASDARTVAKIRELIAPATRYRDVTSYFTSKSSNTTKKLVLIDEVDGISGVAERGGVGEILNVIKETSFPIVLAENEWKKNLQKIYNACQVYEVKRASDESVLKLLNKIAHQEVLSISKDELRRLATSVHGDYRAAITDLQLSSSSNRDRQQSLFEAIHIFFSARYPDEVEEVLRVVPIPMKDFYLWVFENLLEGTEKNRLSTVFKLIADADMILGHILELQEWSMYPHFIGVIKTISTLTNKLSGRTQSPRWFGKKTVAIEELMNEHCIGRDEAKILDELKKQINK